MARTLLRTRAFNVSFAHEASFTGIPLCRRTPPHSAFHVAGAFAVVLGVADMLWLDGYGAGLSGGCETLWRWLFLLALTIRPPNRVGPRFFARLASVPDPAGGSDFLKSPGDVAPPIGLLGDFVSIANDGTV